jgi:hypothetical protein
MASFGKNGSNAMMMTLANSEPGIAASASQALRATSRSSTCVGSFGKIARSLYAGLHRGGPILRNEANGSTAAPARSTCV